MLFAGECQCVYCGSKISFMGNTISYQTQSCANHNQEHQFPGMKVVVVSIRDKSQLNDNLPVYNTGTAICRNSSMRNLDFHGPQQVISNHDVKRKVQRTSGVAQIHLEQTTKLSNVYKTTAGKQSISFAYPVKVCSINIK